MLIKFKKKTLIGISLGVFLGWIVPLIYTMITDNPSPIVSITFWSSKILIIWGCYCWAKGKGYHSAWGILIGMLDVFGIIILAFFPDRYKNLTIQEMDEIASKKGKVIIKLLDLFRPKWKHKDPGKRLEAVKGLEDQKLLADIAKNAKDKDIRIAAVEKLKDQKVLAKAEKKDKDVREIERRTFNAHQKFYVFLVPYRREAQMAADYVNRFLEKSNFPASAVTVMANNRSGNIEIEAKSKDKTIDLENTEQKYLLFIPTPTLEHVKTNTIIWGKIINISEGYANKELGMMDLMLLGIDCLELLKNGVHK